MNVPGFIARPVAGAGRATGRLAKRTVLGVVAAAALTFLLIVLDAILLGDDGRAGEGGE